jgi:hypothetical protein
VAVLQELPVSVSRLSGADLSAILGLVDRLGALAAAGRFTLAADADHRGEVTSSRAGSLRQWVTERCPSLDARDAADLAKTIQALSGTGVDPTLEPARTAVAAGRLSVPAGVQWNRTPGSYDHALAGSPSPGRQRGG